MTEAIKKNNLSRLFKFCTILAIFCGLLMLGAIAAELLVGTLKALFNGLWSDGSLIHKAAAVILGVIAPAIIMIFSGFLAVNVLIFNLPKKQTKEQTK